MRALVLGAGSIGTRHAGNLTRLGLDVTVADVDPAAAAACAAVAGARVTEREQAEPTDIVVVATPSSRHVDDLAWALDRGADVFVEKPLATSFDGIDRALALARAYPDRVLMVGCNLRFSEGFAALTARLPEIGRPAVILADYGWWLPAWRPRQDYRASYSATRALGGGIVLDAIHEIDYTAALGGPIVSVQAQWSSTGLLEVDVEDVADLSCRHESGVHSHIHVDYLRRRYARSCTVIGAQAELRWDVPRRRVEHIGEAGSEPRVVAADVDTDPNLQYVREMEHFLAAVSARAPTCNGIERAAATVGVALDALEHGA